VTVGQKHRVDVRAGNTRLDQALAAGFPGVDQHERRIVLQQAGGKKFALHG
jgi:hypothetical protein